VDIKKTSYITRAYRLTRVITHTLYGIFVAAFIIPYAKPNERERVIHNWSKGILKALNIKVHIFGNPPSWDTLSTMFVANHISWVDIHALNSVRTVRFIAKSQIRSWPIFGWFAVKSNTLFIDREKKQDASRVVDTASESLIAGDCMCYFPEGTTTDGTELKVFKGSLMQAAITAKANLWPLAIRYPNPDGTPNVYMAFAGETTLVESIWSIACLQNPVVELEFLPVISSSGHDRRGLTLLVRKQIEEKLRLKTST